MKIQLVEWSEDNRESLVKICNEVDRTYLSDGLPFPYNLEHADSFIEYITDRKDNCIIRAISVDGEKAGSISVERKKGIFAIDSEMGYFLRPDMCSKGIMTKAVEKICNLAFEKLKIERITAMVFSSNIASEKVLLKNGFSLEGIMKNAVIKNGIFYDLCIYGKLK